VLTIYTTLESKSLHCSIINYLRRIL